jgi:multiple sugar transport system permease protein
MIAESMPLHLVAQASESSLRAGAIMLGVLIVLGGVASYALDKAKPKGTKRLPVYLTYVGLTVGALLMALPFYYMLITSVKTPSEANAFPPTWWPQEFRWENYNEAWNLGQQKQRVTFTRYFQVSLITTVVSTTGALLTAIMAGYAFAKMKFFGSGAFFYVMLAMYMVPGQVLLVPNYLILNSLGWLDTYAALIVPWTASVLAIFLLRQFMVSVPDELWDAAQIDGASRFRFLWTIIVPLSKPAIITAGIFLFLGNWNSLLWPLIVTKSPEMRTIQVGLQAFEQGSGTDYHLLMAASTIVVAPVVIGFFFLQRYFIAGIARSGIK